VYEKTGAEKNGDFLLHGFKQKIRVSRSPDTGDRGFEPVNSHGRLGTFEGENKNMQNEG
jgi:hypothetical protein